jgi:tetratricopeptide (TPR) repeat protein
MPRLNPKSTTAALLALTLTLTLGAPLPAMAEQDAGAYLSARAALRSSDYHSAAAWYARALLADATNADILEGAVFANLAVGEIEPAAQAAKQLLSISPKNQIGALAMYAKLARDEDFTGILAGLDDGKSMGGLLDELLKGWAELGAGTMSDALATFDSIAKTKGIEAFGLYHKALALASAGDFGSAEDILSGRDGTTIGLMRRGLIAHAQILSKLERNPDAVALLRQSFPAGSDLEIDDLQRRLTAGEPVEFDVARNASEGIAEAFYSLAAALSQDAENANTVMYARIAMQLRPDNAEAILLTANVLDRAGQHQAAAEVFARISAESPVFHLAEIGRAEANHAAGNTEASLEILRNLARTHGQLLNVQLAFANGLRRAEMWAEAIGAYDSAVMMLPTSGGSGDASATWSVYYSRGISHERNGDFAAAETDFRKALALNPDQPQVLNYLGYSYVDRGENLDEALGMIERAVAGQPDSGYIIDSLAWAYFRLGRYQDALAPMEKASLLEPVDPIVTDHLGDVYWAVGRTREAQFQWSRALSFDPIEKDAARIRLKLEIGLDAVLAQEGAKPLIAVETTQNGD